MKLTSPPQTAKPFHLEPRFKGGYSATLRYSLANFNFTLILPIAKIITLITVVLKLRARFLTITQLIFPFCISATSVGNFRVPRLLCRSRRHQHIHSQKYTRHHRPAFQGSPSKSVFVDNAFGFIFSALIFT